MQQNPRGDNLQVYAALSTLKVEPPQNEMNNGVVPLDTLPAGWWNWLWNAITQAQNDTQFSLDTVYQEINAVLTHAGITPNPEQFDQLKQAIITLRAQIATAVDVGSVLSTETGTNGSVKVASDGKMTVNGFGDLLQLQTLMKDTLVEAINEVFNATSALDDEVGDLTTLTTENKSSLVSAINELKAASGEGAAALEGRVDTIEDNIGTMNDLETTDKSSLVSAINEVNAKEITSSGQISPRFTYVVDSDQALLDWANNAGGNDYSAVLIRRGTWTSTVGANLTTAGTKVVVGEAGSKLVFNEVEQGLFYDDRPTTPGYWMRDVSVECTGNGERTRNHAVAFYLCINLINCTGKGMGHSNGYGETRGFQGCHYLTNCTGIGTGYGGRNNHGFYYCHYLTNCTGTGTKASSTGVGSTANGFYHCTNLTNCTGTATGSNHNGYAFWGCTNLTNCTGTGTGNNRGVGFYSCKRVSGCKKGSTCSTSVFESSYASFSETSTYAVADTANGGFNDTTN